MTRAAVAASALKPIMSATDALRVDSRSPTKANALRARATGSPRSGFRESWNTARACAPRS